MAFNNTEYITGTSSRGLLHRLLHRLRNGAHIPVVEMNALSFAAPAASAINTNLLDGVVNSWTAVDGMGSMAVHIIGSAGISAGAIIFEGSNDASVVAGVAIPVQEYPALTNLVAATTVAANASRMFVAPMLYKYIRVRISTAFTGGTVRAAAVLKSMAFESVSYASSGSTTVSGAVTATTTPATVTLYSLNASNTTNLTSVKASSGVVFGVSASNTGAAVRYLKLYNKASAPVVATDVPVLVIPIPATSTVNLPLGALGRRFTTGIAIAVVSGATDTDATAVSAANEVKINIDYV